MENQQQQEHSTNQHSESAEKAIRDSTVIEFFNRCSASAGNKREWFQLSPNEQMQFFQAAQVMHHIVFNG
jgi:hypothetical protein